ncbi:6633_t:CDS:2 [Diversispora eburnea]|uniref:6633_t:CDS:1 n=1 Tax=Diversispora eburnea TaxID=1213867 RepID=A0A9N9BDJ5_9GLOM|nr:6633_t:CDS:2 [Diversispora eburnea]
MDEKDELPNTILIIPTCTALTIITSHRYTTPIPILLSYGYSQAVFTSSSASNAAATDTYIR